MVVAFNGAKVSVDIHTTRSAYTLYMYFLSVLDDMYSNPCSFVS